MGENTEINSEAISEEKSFDVSKGITRGFVRIEYLSDYIKSLAKNYLKINEYLDASKELDKYYLNGYLKPNILCHIEYPYVDRMYRDTYYNYHSTKRAIFEKDCIRISLFDPSITEDHFFKDSKFDELKEESNFLGYLIIRPTKYGKIGRTFLSPYALNGPSFHCCKTTSMACINGIDLRVSGFPHASQDGEFHRCAEISVWVTMEYFSQFHEFKSALPSLINSMADDLNYQRSIPSDGLLLSQISYTLKKMGFGVKAYQGFLNPVLFTMMVPNDFKLTFNDYVESGIPVLTLINNSKGSKHCVVAIGHEGLTDKGLIRNELISEKVEKGKSEITLIDSSEFYNKKYVFIDDNLAPYVIASFENPLENYKLYSPDEMVGAQIFGFIIPLHSEIYIDSKRIRKVFDTLIKSEHCADFINREESKAFVSRFILVTSRSFKRSFYLNSEIDIDTRITIESLALPKYFWIIEISSVDNYLINKSIGFIIVDATEANHIDSVIAIVWRKHFKVRDIDGTFILKEDCFKDETYPLYIDNLKLYTHGT